MIKCVKCNSTKHQKSGTRPTLEGYSQRYKCKDCGTSFSVRYDQINEDEELTELEVTESKPVYVVTSALNNTKVNASFLAMLRTYCLHNDAELIVIPIKYRNPTAYQQDDLDELWWDDAIADYLHHDNLISREFGFKILSKIKIQATAESPLSGLDSLTRGMNTIVGHPQLQTKTLPVFGDVPVFLTTTGSITEPMFSETKAGYKADFNHSLSALVIECDPEISYSHIRQLHYSKDGICDLQLTYSEDEVYRSKHMPALVVGDEHVVFLSKDVMECTYKAEDSIVNTIEPSMIVRHDVLDCFSVTHHHKHNFVLQYKKAKTKQNNIFDEIKQALDHVEDTTPEYCQSIIISSNHNEHLLKWLNEADPKKDITNAKMYHGIMYAILDYIDENEDIPDPLQLIAKSAGSEMKFLSRNDSISFAGIELGNHGDHGFNGSRGSRLQYSKLPVKSVIGHSHSPGIEKGCYQTGTSSNLRMEYNKGPSSWANTHCIVHANGKRQLVTIIKGKWKA